MKKIKNLLSSIKSPLPIISLAICLVIGFGSVFVFNACNQVNAQTGFSSFKEPPEPDNSIINVVQAAPKGDLDYSQRNKEIYIVFNHPIVPLAVLKQKTTGVFRVYPPVKGKFRWYGSRICSFKADKGWKPGQRYRVIIPRGLRSLNGKRLTKRYVLSFKIKTPRLRPYIYGGYRSSIDYNHSFQITLNFPVTKRALYRYFRLQVNYGNYPYQLFHSKSGKTINKKIYIVKASRKFPRDSKVVLILKRGLRSYENGALLKSSYEKSFKTHGPLTVKIEGSPDFYQDLWEAKFKFNNKVSTSQAIKNIVVKPYAPLIMKPKGKTYYIRLNKWRLKPGTEYTFYVKRFRDVHGNLLRRSKNFMFSVPDYKPKIYVDSTNYIVESKMPNVIPVKVTSNPNFTVSVGSFTIADLQKDLGSYSFSIERDITKKSHVINTGLKKNQRNSFAVNLQKYTSGKGGKWLGIEYKGKTINYRGDTVDEKFTQTLQITDLGITVKEGASSTHVWVNSLSSGKAVSGARIEIYDLENRIASGRTNRKGYGRIYTKRSKLMGKSIIAVTSPGGDKAYVTSRDHSLSLYHYTQNYSYNASKPVLMGQLVFDRKLYRPGDKVEVKASLNLRKNGVLKPLKRVYVKYELSDSKGNSLLKSSTRTSSQGGLWFSYKTKKDAPLGHYRITIRYSKDYVNDTFQVEEFRPAKFMVNVDGMKNSRVGKKLKVSVEGKYLFGAPMPKAPVVVNFQRRKKDISFEHYSGYVFGDGQLWERDSVDWSGTGFHSGSSALLNGAGKYEVTALLTSMTKKQVLTKPKRKYIMSDVYDLKMEATVKDVDKKSVTKTAICTVYPARYLIGIKPVNRYQDFKKTFKFNIVAVKNDGGKTRRKKVMVRITRESWKSILTKGPGGTLQTKNIQVKTLVKQQVMYVSSVPKLFNYKVKKSGTYSITVQGVNSMVYARDSFYGFGGSFYSWFYNSDDALTLVPDKVQYKPGENAKILVQSPFKKARAIVTVERENVLWQRVYNVRGGGNPIVIPVKKSYLPNVYVSVMLIRPRVKVPQNASRKMRIHYRKNDLGIPKMKMGIVKLSVDNSSKKAKLKIRTNKESYGPGDMMTIYINSEPGAEIAMTVADRAVLDLIGYSYNNPVNKFYQNWPLGIRVLENRKFLLKQYQFSKKGNSPGGQGKGDDLNGVGGFSKDSEDGSRKDIRYTAYWKPNIRADRNGKAVIRFKLPHNLTTFRIMAFASINGKYRVKKKEFQVKKAMVIQKNLPRFIRPGDVLRFGAVVTNQTNIKGGFYVNMTSPLLKITLKRKFIYLKPGESKEVLFTSKLKIKNYKALLNKLIKNNKRKNGQILVKGWLSVKPYRIKRFWAQGYKSKDIKDRLLFKFPVREQPPEEAFTISGFTDKKTSEYVSIPRKGEVLQGMGDLTVSLSPTALVGLNKAFTFFKSNPYFCLEQRASAFFLTMSAGKLLKEFNFQPPSGKAYDFNRIENLFLGELKKFQNSNGGFRLWKGTKSKYDNPYLTAYVALVLTLAKKQGYSVPSDSLSSAISYLQEYIRYPKKDGISYVMETFALINYVFAENGDYNSSLTRALVYNDKYLSIRAKGYLMLAIAKGEGLRTYKNHKVLSKYMLKIKNSMEITTRKVHFSDVVGSAYKRAFYTKGATLGVILNVMMHLDYHNPLINKMVNAVIGTKKNNLWSDSHSSGVLAYSLLQYRNLYEKNNTNGFSGFVTLNKSLIKKQKFENSLKVFTQKIAINKLYNYGKAGKIYPMTFRSSKRARLYYSASLNYYPNLKEIKPRDEGIGVYRRVLDMARADKKNPRGKEVTTRLKRGEMYLVHLRIVVPKPVTNIVILDPLSSNTEVVNTSFKTEKSSMDKYTRSSSSYSYYWWQSENPVTEYRDDRVVITQDYMSAGMHDFYYIMRPLVKGRSYKPQCSAKLMYEPEVFGRSSAGIVYVY